MSQIFGKRVKKELSSEYGKIIKQGWLEKKGAKRKNWSTRWFVVYEQAYVEYYVSSKLEKLKGSIQMGGRAVEQTNLEKFEFQLGPGSSSGQGRIFYMRAYNGQEMREWIETFHGVSFFQQRNAQMQGLQGDGKPVQDEIEDEEIEEEDETEKGKEVFDKEGNAFLQDLTQRQATLEVWLKLFDKSEASLHNFKSSTAPYLVIASLFAPLGLPKDLVVELNASSEAPAKPVEQSVRFVEPAEQTDKSSEQSTKPVEQSAKPEEQTDKPSEQSAKPVEQTAKPAEQTAKPAEQTASNPNSAELVSAQKQKKRLRHKKHSEVEAVSNILSLILESDIDVDALLHVMYQVAQFNIPLLSDTLTRWLHTYKYIPSVMPKLTEKHHQHLQDLALQQQKHKTLAHEGAESELDQLLDLVIISNFLLISCDNVNQTLKNELVSRTSMHSFRGRMKALFLQYLKTFLKNRQQELDAHKATLQTHQDELQHLKSASETNDAQRASMIEELEKVIKRLRDERALIVVDALSLPAPATQASELDFQIWEKEEALRVLQENKIEQAKELEIRAEALGEMLKLTSIRISKCSEQLEARQKGMHFIEEFFNKLSTESLKTMIQTLQDFSATTIEDLKLTTVHYISVFLDFADSLNRQLEYFLDHLDISVKATKNRGSVKKEAAVTFNDYVQKIKVLRKSWEDSQKQNALGQVIQNNGEEILIGSKKGEVDKIMNQVHQNFTKWITLCKENAELLNIQNKDLAE